MFAFAFRSGFLPILVALRTCLPVHAQPPMATMDGLVVDGVTGQPMPGAALWLLPGNASLTATTDSSGRFRIPAVPVGHYALRVAALGFDTLEVPELWLRAGKQTVERIELTATAGVLGTVTVNAMARERPAVLGVRTFTVEQSLRWPATFFDPARLAVALPGVAGVNDQANHLSIRGNSPNANTWLLEGVEIVNPSHTGNAGTSTDLPTLSGGGVNILSAQMLGTSQLLTGVLPMDRDNALGGILDMRLRNGNTKEQEWTLQAGLLGIDAATEGPMGKSGRSSYLVNYRYSTVGLLGALGVDLGDEAISFQDLAFHVVLPAGPRGELRLFGMGGASSNVFEAAHDTSAWEVDKDDRNIDYTSRMGATGANIRIPLGGRTSLSSTIAVSEIDQVRTEERLRTDFTLADHARAELDERKIAGMVKVEGAAGKRFRYSTGAGILQRRLTSSQNLDAAGWLLRPWAQGTLRLGHRWRATAGLGLAHFTFTTKTVAEPRAELEWQIKQGRTLALAAGIRSQLPQWQSFDAARNLWLTGEAIGLTRSRDIVLGYDHPFNERLVLHAEAYYQWLTHVPIERTAPGYGLGMVNTWDEQVFGNLSPTGTAANLGVELGLDRRFANGCFYQGNLSLYNSSYTGTNEMVRDTRWNGQYIVNLFGGKEFRKEKEARVRTWGFSGRMNAVGGQWSPPIPVHTDANGIIQFPGTVEWQRLADAYRIDVRVYLKQDRNGLTGMWALDLQNLTNVRNEAFRYFDVRKAEVVTKYQLGIIPNLSYRIEF